jgi:hypothetical protein
MEFCACNGSILNTGVPNKQRVVASGVILVAVPMKADDGTFNQIANDAVIDQAYIDALINNDDESKRWYPIGEFKNQEDVRGDVVTESFNDGSSVITQQGVRTYTGWLINYAPAFIKALDSFKCVDFGVFVIDSCGAITGSLSVDGTKLNPIRVNNNHWNPQLIKATPTVSEKVQLMFEFSQLEKDKNLRVISETEITADLLNIEGLLPLKATISSESATGFVAALTVDYDLFLAASQDIVPAWTDADFALFNKTQNSSISITSVTEAPEGTYTFVIPSQSSADVLELTNVKTAGQKPGFGLKQEIIIP